MRRSGFGAAAEVTLALGADALGAGEAAEDTVVDFDAHPPAAMEMPTTSSGMRTVLGLFMTNSSRGVHGQLRGTESEPLASMRRMRSISALWSASTSEAKRNTYSFWVAPSDVNSFCTIEIAPW
jgi:hypothetical protein